MPVHGAVLYTREIVNRPRETAAAELWSPADAAPTRARFGVLGFLCSLAFVLYLDRVCIGQALPSIQKDLGLDNGQTGYALGAFLIAYGLFEVPTGRWGDRFGSRGVLTRIVLWWSLFTALTGVVNGLLALVAVRFLFGAGEAGLSERGPRDRGVVSAERTRQRAGVGDHRGANRRGVRAGAGGLHDRGGRLALDFRCVQLARCVMGGGVLCLVSRRPGRAPTHQLGRAGTHRRRERSQLARRGARGDSVAGGAHQSQYLALGHPAIVLVVRQLHVHGLVPDLSAKRARGRSDRDRLAHVAGVARRGDRLLGERAGERLAAR